MAPFSRCLFRLIGLRVSFLEAAIPAALSLLRDGLRQPRFLWQTLTILPALIVRHRFLKTPVILIRRYAGLGDIVCTLPSVAALRQTHPKAIVIYETRREFTVLIERCADVDIAVEKGSILARLCKRVLKPAWCRYPLLPDEDKPPRPRRRIHLCEEFRISFGLGKGVTQPPKLAVSRPALARIRQRLRAEQPGVGPLIPIHTGPTWRTKEWSAIRWNEFVSLVRSAFDARVIQIGVDQSSYGERSLSPRIEGAKDWVGILSLDEILALLRLGDLFVGIDSGMLHLAGTVSIPCVGIFGPTDPNCFLPLNSPSVAVAAQLQCIGCHHDSAGPLHWRTGCPWDIRCMSELSAEEVFAACSHFLEERHRVGR